MKKASDLTIADWVIGGIVGGAAGFLLGYLSKGPISEWKAKHDIDPSHKVHHADIGGTIATLGALSAGTNPLAPVLTGFGTGLAIEDYADQYGYRVYKQAMKKRDELKTLVESEHARPKTEWQTIPDIPKSARYAAMADAMRNIIYQDAHEPEVRGAAETIIKDAGLDGRDTEAILTAFTLWIRDNITYVHDAAKDLYGKPTDQYRHAYITLPKSPTNPRGTGTGDCDCLFILWAAMALSVGIENIVGLLVAQQRPGVYNHIMAAYSPFTADPKSVSDLIVYELTEDMPIGWVPPAASYGLMIV